MNAYELADKCGLKIDDYGFAIEIRDTLRQQADQIAELKLNLGLAEHFEKKSADRIAELEKEAEDWEKTTKWMEMTRQVVKPLSDEEIAVLVAPVPLKPTYEDLVTLARAIEERILGK